MCSTKITTTLSDYSLNDQKLPPPKRPFTYIISECGSYSARGSGSEINMASTMPSETLEPHQGLTRMWIPPGKGIRMILSTISLVFKYYTWTDAHYLLQSEETASANIPTSSLFNTLMNYYLSLKVSEPRQVPSWGSSLSACRVMHALSSAWNGLCQLFLYWTFLSQSDISRLAVFR